jgi:hypothetical protein
VDAPADTPAGKVLGTTAVGQWGPVPADGLPPATSITGHDWNYGGSGNANSPGDFKVNTTTSTPTSLRVNMLDRSGADRSAWLTAITAGDAVTITQGSNVATFTVSGTPSTAGSGSSAFRSMSGAWTGAPIASFTGPGVAVTLAVESAAPDGSLLALQQGEPAWTPPPAPGMTQAQADARYLGLGGGTLTGPLTVPALPSPLPGNAIPKSYADSTYWHYWTGTQAQYDALPVKDDHTLYAITG